LALIVANLAYFFAVTQRTSLGVASIEASHRFSTSASQLASLAVLQLVVYAGMQVPVGIFLDRFGPRVLLSVGAVAMGAGQILVAFAPSLQVAIVGRMLVGLGDACTFISMIRMANNWLSGARASRAQQWMATLGQLGQVASAVPFAILLHLSGWESAFATLASVSFVSAAIIWLLAQDAPKHLALVAPNLRKVVSSLFVNLKKSSTRMAFWTHFSTQSSGTMFALLWGVPFVTRGEGYSAGTASALLILFVLTNATLGPLIGSLAEKRESVRSSIIFWAPLAGMLAWIVVLGWPTRAPILLLVFLVIVIGIGGPTSMLSFDYTRMYVQKSQLGATNGFVNIGGFLASLTMMAAIGFLLDALNSGHKRATLYNLEHFRVALPIQFLVTIFGMVMYQVERRKTAQSELLAE